MVEGLNPMEAFGRAKAKAATEEKMRLQKMHAEHVLENFRWAMGNLAFVQGAYELGMQAIEKDPQGVIAEKFTSALDKSFAIANKESSILHDMETLRANDVHAKENGTPDEQRLWNLEEQAYNSRNELAHVLRDALRPIIRVAANLDYANDGENVRDEDCPPQTDMLAHVMSERDRYAAAIEKLGGIDAMKKFIPSLEEDIAHARRMYNKYKYI